MPVNDSAADRASTVQTLQDAVSRLGSDAAGVPVPVLRAVLVLLAPFARTGQEPLSEEAQRQALERALALKEPHRLPVVG